MVTKSLRNLLLKLNYFCKKISPYICILGLSLKLDSKLFEKSFEIKFTFVICYTFVEVYYKYYLLSKKAEDDITDKKLLFIMKKEVIYLIFYHQSFVRK